MIYILHKDLKTYSYILRAYIYLFTLIAQSVKNLPAMWEAWVPFLGGKDPLEKEMETYSSILTWKSMDRETGGLLPLLLLSRFSRVRLCATP